MIWLTHTYHPLIPTSSVARHNMLASSFSISLFHNFSPSYSNCSFLTITQARGLTARKKQIVLFCDKNYNMSILVQEFIGFKIIEKLFTYGRHWISWCVRIVAPLPKFLETSLKFSLKKEIDIRCHVSRVTCHLSHVTYANNQSHRPSPC